MIQTPSLVCLLERGKEKGAESDAAILVSGTSVGLVGPRLMHEHGIETALLRLILPLADAQQNHRHAIRETCIRRLRDSASADR